jgi:hypothetical protein
VEKSTRFLIHLKWKDQPTDLLVHLIIFKFLGGKLFEVKIKIKENNDSMCWVNPFASTEIPTLRRIMEIDLFLIMSKGIF